MIIGPATRFCPLAAFNGQRRACASLLHPLSLAPRFPFPSPSPPHTSCVVRPHNPLNASDPSEPGRTTTRDDMPARELEWIRRCIDQSENGRHACCLYAGERESRQAGCGGEGRAGSLACLPPLPGRRLSPNAYMRWLTETNDPSVKEHSQHTIGVEFQSRTIQIGEKRVKLQVRERKHSRVHTCLFALTPCL